MRLVDTYHWWSFFAVAVALCGCELDPVEQELIGRWQLVGMDHPHYPWMYNNTLGVTLELRLLRGGVVEGASNVAGRNQGGWWSSEFGSSLFHIQWVGGNESIVQVELNDAGDELYSRWVDSLDGSECRLRLTKIKEDTQ